MDESREAGMQSGWPGEWPRPDQRAPSAPAPAQPQEPPQAPTDGSWETIGWPGWSGEPEASAAGSSSDQPRRTPRGVVTAVGLVLAGALAGGVGIAAVQHGSPTTTSAAAAQGFPGAAGSAGGQGQLGQGQLGQGQPGQGFPGDGFGRDDDGEQRFIGTVTAVSGSSVTVQTQSGTATYEVSGDTQVIKDGQVASVSDLASGDQVLMHVLTGGSTPTVERIIAGRLPQLGGAGLPGDRDGDGQRQGDGGGAPGGPAGGSTGSSGGTTTGLQT